MATLDTPELVDQKLASSPSRSSRFELNRSSLLIVEDSKIQAHALIAALEDLPIDVQLAETGVQALELIDDHEFDLLVIDYELPDTNAHHLINTIRLQGFQVPFIITTARGSEEIAVELMKLGAVDYLIKSLELVGSFAETIQSHLKKIQSARIMRETEQAVRAAEQRTRKILEASPEAFLCFSVDGVIIDWNDSAESIFGFKAKQVVGKSIFETIVPPVAMPQCQQLLEQFITNPESKTYAVRQETTAKHEQGHELPVELSIASMPQGDTWVFNAFLHDISNRKEMESQLYQSEKMASIGQLAAGVAHEINNPIGFVSSNLSSLSGYVGDYLELIDLAQKALLPIRESSPEAGQFWSRMEDLDFEYLKSDTKDLIEESTDGLTRVKEIVQNLKSFARLDESGEKDVDLNEGLESTLKVVWNELKYKCTIHKDFETLPFVHCQAGQINQVFMNLLVNAAQAVEKQGEIYLETRHEGNEAVVRIRDNGCGIPEENLKKLFTPFFTTKPVGSGTGLGLSISYNIIIKHGGQLNVQSVVGEGTTFEIRLPVVSSES